MKTLLYNRLLNYNFKELFEKKGYAYFEKGAYNLNNIYYYYRTWLLLYGSTSNEL